MPTRSKLLFAALAATATMLTLVASASARNFRLSEREFEILFRELEVVIAQRIACPVTLLGHFIERTIPKTVGTQVGVIQHAEPPRGAEPPCTGGTITVLNATLPWRINYEGFTGTLPRIDAIRLSIIRLSFRDLSGGVGCLAGTTEREPLFGELLVNSVSGKVEGFRVDETLRIRLVGSLACSLVGEASFSGTGTVLDLPGRNAITVTLI